jgi:hypothetical protein
MIFEGKIDVVIGDAIQEILPGPVGMKHNLRAGKPGKDGGEGIEPEGVYTLPGRGNIPAGKVHRF